MKILVLYYSKGGNTRRLAEAVTDGIASVNGVEAILRSTDAVTRDEFAGASGVVAGSPVYFGTMAAPLKAVFDDFVGVRKQMEGKIGAAFTTSGDATGGKETTLFSILQAMMIYGMVIAGDPLAATGHYGTACVGAPDETACSHAALLGQRVASLAKRLAVSA